MEKIIYWDGNRIFDGVWNNFIFFQKKKLDLIKNEGI